MTDQALLELTAQVVARGDHYSAMGRKTVANNFYNLLPLIAEVRSAWPDKTEENERGSH